MTRYRDRLNLAFIGAYIEIFVNEWGCRLDHEDGSTAPFSTLAALAASSLIEAADTCLVVASE